MDLTPEDQISAIHLWNENFHPLTCGNDSNHENLQPRCIYGEVVLVCPTCGLIQAHIPDCVFGFWKDCVRDENGKPIVYRLFDGINTEQETN